MGGGTGRRDRAPLTVGCGAQGTGWGNRAPVVAGGIWAGGKARAWGWGVQVGLGQGRLCHARPAQNGVK